MALKTQSMLWTEVISETGDRKIYMNLDVDMDFMEMEI